MRSPPSAGALYPLELSIAAGKIASPAAGIDRYLAGHHEITQIAAGRLLPARRTSRLSEIKSTATAAEIVRHWGSDRA